MIYFIKKDGQIVNIKKWKIHLINNLKMNMLIDINILVLKEIVIDLKWKTVIIYLYNFIKLKLLIKSYVINRFHWIIFINKHTVIPFYSH